MGSLRIFAVYGLLHILVSLPSYAMNCENAMEELHANPHSDLRNYGAVHSLSLPSEGEVFHSKTSAKVTERDASGNATRASFRVLTHNPDLEVKIITEAHPEGQRLESNGDFHEGTININHLMEYEIEVFNPKTNTTRRLVDPNGSLFNTPEWLELQGKPRDGELRNVFWDQNHPEAYVMKHAPVDLRGKPHAISEQELFLLVSQFKGGPEKVTDTYRFIAESGVIEKLKEELGYNAVEFLPLNASEDGVEWQWRYQVFGQRAPNSRYGSPDEFKMMMDAFNGNGVGVILDAVVGHYPEQGNEKVAGRKLSEKGLHLWERADGTPLYGSVPTKWGTKRFDYANPNIREFLTDSIVEMVSEYRMSGVRLDNLDGIVQYDGPGGGGGEFVNGLVAAIHRHVPHTLLIGESFNGKTDALKATHQDGKGIHQTIGWELFDTFRKYSQGNTEQIDVDEIAGVYRSNWKDGKAVQFQYITTHDEATRHIEMSDRGGATGAYPGSLLGDPTNIYTQGKLKAFSSLAMFSGSSYLDMLQMRTLQQGDFSKSPEVNWAKLNDPSTKPVSDYFAEASKLFTGNNAFAVQNLHPNIEHHVDNDNKVIFLKRKNFKTGETFYIAVNLGHHSIKNYKFGVQESGNFRVALDSADARFGGTVDGVKSTATGTEIQSHAEPIYEKPNTLVLPELLPYQVLVLQGKAGSH